jgi:20S proteasome alpha/beta subunit
MKDWAQVTSKDVREAYENELNQRFFQEKLAKLGYADIAEFRKNGFAEMGKDLYHQYSMDLAKYDLGLELLCYGFNKSGDRFIFEEANPGKVIWHNTLGYAAIGSGSLMALAALNRKPLVHNLSLNETIYRLLDAKFSSETARDVGKKTYLIMLNSRGKVQIAPQPYVERIRNIWDDQQKKPEPPEALEVIAEITDPFITPEN